MLKNISIYCFIVSQNDIFDNEIHITSLSYIPGANINFYLGNLNFVFIRESTLVKEVRTMLYLKKKKLSDIMLKVF